MGRGDSVSAMAEKAGVPWDFIQLLRADPCAFCGDSSYGLDHIESQKRGGSHNWDNLAGICVRCNSRKRTSSLLGYLLWERYDIMGQRAALDDLNRTLRDL